MSSLLISGEKIIRKKLKTLYKNKKRDVSGSSKEEVVHGGPICYKEYLLLNLGKRTCV